MWQYESLSITASLKSNIWSPLLVDGKDDNQQEAVVFLHPIIIVIIDDNIIIIIIVCKPPKIQIFQVIRTNEN